jgi:hypothetical protein
MNCVHKNVAAAGAEARHAGKAGMRGRRDRTIGSFALWRFFLKSSVTGICANIALRTGGGVPPRGEKGEFEIGCLQSQRPEEALCSVESLRIASALYIRGGKKGVCGVLRLSGCSVRGCGCCCSVVVVSASLGWCWLLTTVKKTSLMLGNGCCTLTLRIPALLND